MLREDNLGVIPGASRHAYDSFAHVNAGTWVYLKPWFDRVFAIAALIAVSPIMLIISAAIKLESPGPVFFRQPRFGVDRTIICVTKFRTMHHTAADIGGRQQTVRNDARVTRLGAILRRTCLDELPQFWDVLCGRLSVVGPRPHPLDMEVEGVRADSAIAYYHSRHAVRPGITGLAQVQGNSGPVETLEKGRDRILYDIEYINSLSFRGDMKIIAKTLGVVLSQKSNY
ncbi:sugar transferase [Pseudotabrizicola sp. 4114]|uniref:sugar transferase n=1 Tax=Pseudotabrizicola sp. 4114 TaxID=2817731 RepID=UPI00285AA987|nr:lipopolysaccharide/colanic/teichoic acid biosynthesis glycosyltransferase [Pseudorhodobacter sp. 4114]